jgi:hypothetical protein
MNDTLTMISKVREAWSGFPAPPAEDLKAIQWECGEESVGTFAGVAPVNVDIGSVGFLGCEPLLAIPPEAAAAYLGTYMLSLLEGILYEEKVGIFHDLLTRAHLLHCLTRPEFWERVVSILPPEARQTMKEFCFYLLLRRDLLGLSEDQVEFIRRQAAKL